MSYTDKFGLVLTKMEYKSTQEYVPIKDIVDGIIITEQNRYIKIMEIVPVNFAMKSRQEQAAIIEQYYTWLRTAPQNMMIKCMTKPTQINVFLDEIYKSLRKEENKGCIALAQNYIDFLKAEGTFQSVERHFYLIFEYEPENEFFRAKEQAEIIAALNRTASQYATDFMLLGNKTPTSDSPDITTAEFLYDFYNRKICMQQPFETRVMRIERDYRTVNHLDKDAGLPPADIRDLVAPISVKADKKDYLIIDGLYYSYYYIPSQGYPDTIVADSWLAVLISFGYGYEVDIYYKKEDAATVMSTLNIKTRFTNLKLNNREESNPDFEDVVDSSMSLKYIKQALKSEDLYNVCILVTISAYTLEELYEKRHLLMTTMVRQGVKLNECLHFQEQAFLSSAPYLNLSPKIYNISKRNMMTSAVAESYPYTAFSLCDPGGILMGIHQLNKSLVMYDPYDSDKYSNANLAIYGASGMGKTYTLLSVTTRLRYLGVQNFILSPDKQDEFRRVADAIGGLFVDMSVSSDSRINPLEIWPIQSPNNTFLNGNNYDEKSWLIDKIENLKIWFQYLIPDISRAEKTMIEASLVRAYKKYGITRDNDSLYINAEHKVKKPMPILDDLIEEMHKEKNMREDILTIMRQFTEGSARNLNGQTNIDLDNRYIVFGFEHLQGDMLAPMMYIALEVIWNKARSDKTKKKMISIDEGWKLIDPRNPQIGDFVIEIFKVIRGFGGGALFSTQSLADLFRSDKRFGDTILSCAHSNILLGMEPNDIRMISDHLELSESEISTIAKYRQGDALLCAGHNHIPVTVKASPLEHRLFTTKRSDLEKMVNQMQDPTH